MQLNNMYDMLISYWQESTFRINNLKRKVKCEDSILNNYVLPEEMKQSVFMWLKENQSLFLSESNFDNIKHILMIEKDENGLFRCMGRLSNANLNFNTKFPILLQNDHYLR